MTWQRRLLTTAGVIVTIAIAATAATALWYRHAVQPRAEGELHVQGLLAPVDVSRDTLGVPSIRAANEHDMLFTQGYVHAQDRLWQMELMRHVADARLSELFGERTLDTDRFLRIFGLPRAADVQEAALDSASLRRITSYADGVNAFLAEGHPLPPEYHVLGVRPQPWTVRNTLGIEKVMALDLSQYGLSVDRTRAVARLGAERAAALQPAYPTWGPTILESPVPPAAPAAAVAMINAGSITHGSNAWVIGGIRTKSGKPILANDMHLALRAPSIWYLMALHVDNSDAASGGIHVAGMSLPGSPFIVAGHNRAIAWGLTNASTDDADFFIERRDPVDSTRYLTPQGSQPFVFVDDSIRVKGRAAAVPLRYRMTRHGPVISDVVPGLVSGTDVIALQWIGARASHTMLALPALNHATGWSDFRSAVAMFDDPHQNVVYADTAGHIGYVMGGSVPDRGSHLPPSLPVPGWTGEWDWRGYMPFEQHPTEYDPPQDYVVTANNRQAAGAAADRISDGWETPFRAARIREMILAAGHPLTAAYVHRMQLDVHDASALRYRDRATAAARGAGAAQTAALLEQWDGAATRTSTAATVYYLFVDRFREQLVISLYGDSTGWIDRAIVDDVLENRRVPWPAAGSATPPSFDSLAAIAMKQAIALAGGRVWGDVHRVAAEHALGSVAALDRALHLNTGNEAGDGSPTTVNVSHWTDLTGSGPTLSFHSTTGASQRHVVDMADMDGSGGFILPGGQSGVPTSPLYRNQWSSWLNGGLVPIPLNSTPVHVRTLRLLAAEKK